MKHLQAKQEYIDRYDLITINDCRWRVNFYSDYRAEQEKKDPKMKSGYGLVHDVGLYYDLFFTTLKWWENKDATIQQWMDADQHRDELLETAQPPQSVRCLKCFTPLTISHKSIDIRDNKSDRVMFIFDCPKDCRPSRAFFDDGEEYRMKEPTCPKCQTVFETKHERIRDEKVVTNYTCPNCGYKDKYEMELGERKEPPDPDFEKDRDRFCLTEAEGKKAQMDRLDMENLKKLVDGWKEKDKHKEEYKAAAELKKLTVVELEALLTPVIETAGFIKLQFGTPEIGKDVFLPFTLNDAKAGRTDYDSSHTLQKLIKEAVAKTNWRLMTDGISYRLGILTGRLRAFESEEDLLALVSSKEKHEKER